MVQEDVHFNLETVFDEVMKRREEEGAYDQESYNQFVEDILDEKLDRGELSDDDDIEGWTEQLQNRWPEVEEMDTEKPDPLEE